MMQDLADAASSRSQPSSASSGRKGAVGACSCLCQKPIETALQKVELIRRAGAFGRGTDNCAVLASNSARPRVSCGNINLGVSAGPGFGLLHPVPSS